MQRRRGHLAGHVVAPGGQLGLTERRIAGSPVVKRVQLAARAIRAHMKPRQTCPAKCMKSLDPARAALGFLRAFCMKYIAAACMSFDAAFSGSRKSAFRRAVAFIFLDESLHHLEEGHHVLASVLVPTCAPPGQAPERRWHLHRSSRSGHRGRTGSCPVPRYSRGRQRPAGPALPSRKPLSVWNPLMTGVSSDTSPRRPCRPALCARSIR